MQRPGSPFGARWCVAASLCCPPRRGHLGPSPRYDAARAGLRLRLRLPEAPPRGLFSWDPSARLGELRLRLDLRLRLGSINCASYSAMRARSGRCTLRFSIHLEHQRRRRRDARELGRPRRHAKDACCDGGVLRCHLGSRLVGGAEDLAEVGGRGEVLRHRHRQVQVEHGVPPAPRNEDCLPCARACHRERSKPGSKRRRTHPGAG
eukprot:scaffold4687_cov331-Prasinococcus_capsulatus_cf.AAC.1